METCPTRSSFRPFDVRSDFSSAIGLANTVSTLPSEEHQGRVVYISSNVAFDSEMTVQVTWSVQYYCATIMPGVWDCPVEPVNSCGQLFSRHPLFMHTLKWEEDSWALGKSRMMNTGSG